MNAPDKASLNHLRTVTVYTGAGIPRVFRVENLPLLQLKETGDGGLCIYALTGEGSPSLMTRFAPGKWESFDLEYLPYEKPAPAKAEEKKPVAQPVVNLSQAPVRNDATFTGHPSDITQPLPLDRVRSMAPALTTPLPETQSFPVVVASVGGDHPFLLGDLRPLSPEEKSEMAIREQRRSQEAYDVLKARLVEQGIPPWASQGRAASQRDAGQPSSD